MSSESPTVLSVVDGQIVITQERLDGLYKELPALSYILEGHPSFKQKPAAKKRSKRAGAVGNGMRSLRLHDDYGVSRQDVLLLLGFFSAAKRSPETKEDWKRLHTVSLLLGGSNAVDEEFARASLTDQKPPRTYSFSFG